MSYIHVDGVPATKIKTKKIRETADAILLDCEGDEVWFPKAHVKYDDKENTVVVKDWLYKEKFPNG